MNAQPASPGMRWLRYGVIAALVVVLVAGIYLIWPGRAGHKVIGYFTSAVGLYPGDGVRIVGVPVGSIESIEPQPQAVKITMSVKDGVKVPADADAVIMAPNIVSARFIQLAPAYSSGPVMADGATIGLDRTAAPVEWDEVKSELTKLSSSLGPQAGSMQGPLSEFVNQAADTFDGNGDSFRQALRELSQTAGRLGDSRTDLFGTVKNLHILIDALSKSNEQIVQFSGHLASVSQVLADSSTNLDNTLGTLNQALADVRGFLQDNNSDADQPDRQAFSAHEAFLRPVRRRRTDSARHPERAGELLQHLRPGAGCRDGIAVAAELRQPGAVHLWRRVRGQPVRRQHQTDRDLPGADGPRAEPAGDELPAHLVPPDQHHHRVQGADHLRHSGH